MHTCIQSAQRIYSRNHKRRTGAARRAWRPPTSSGGAMAGRQRSPVSTNSAGARSSSAMPRPVLATAETVALPPQQPPTSPAATLPCTSPRLGCRAPRLIATREFSDVDLGADATHREQPRLALVAERLDVQSNSAKRQESSGCQVGMGTVHKRTLSS